MAFFGLTSLGSQDPFQACQQAPIHVFDDNDFSSAWKRVAKDTGCITADDLSAVLKKLYHCPEGTDEPKDILRILQSAFNGSKNISYETFIRTMQDLRQQSEDSSGYFEKGNEYATNSEFRSALYKHHRMERGPNDKYDTPLTSSQEHGWTPPTTVEPIRGKKSCAETLFASAMVQAGVNY